MSPSRKISSTEWERHKAAILGLRFKDKLPLKAPDATGRSLIQVMKDEHQFHATASQYESQIAKWGAVKNLKKRDWESILPVYDDLQSQGLEPRIRVGDHVFDDRKIKKARYHYGGRQTSLPADNIALASSLDETRPWCLEFRQPNGQYVEYFKRNESSDLPRSPTSSALVQTNIHSTSGSQPSQIHFHGVGDVFSAADAMTSTPLIQCPPSLNTPQYEILDMSNSPSIYLDLDTHTFIPTNPQAAGFPAPVISPRYESPNVDDFIYSILHPPSFPRECFSDFNLEALLIPKGSEIDGIRQASSPCPQLTTLAYIDPLLDRLAQYSRWRHGDITLLSMNNIFERLVSLPQLKFSESSSRMESTHVSGRDRDVSLSDIYARIMYSLINNFAGIGIDPVQRLAIFGVLRLTPDGMSYLINGLRSDQFSVAKPVATNLFQLAIEAGDEEVVSIILKETSGRANEINVNKLISYHNHFGPKKYSPLALAAHLHHLGVFKTMLAHGAKLNVGEEGAPNRSMFEVVTEEPCDRCWDDRDTTTHEREVTSIIELCLSLEPERATDYFIEALCASIGFLCELLFEAVPKMCYPKLFSWEAWREWQIQTDILDSKKNDELPLDGRLIPILRLIQEALDNEAADKMIKTLLATCETFNLIQTPVAEYTRLLNEATAIAISNKNTTLVRYFLNHIKPTSGHLASAIHNQDIEMVYSMLEHGAALGGEAVCLRHMYNGIRLVNCECDRRGSNCIFTTPLAEAIRWKNTVLINQLEQGGAFNTLSDDHGLSYSEFDAAAFAASEVGNFGYLKSLITLSPTRGNMQKLAGLIVRVIDQNQLPIALELIVRHANATSTINTPNYASSYLGVVDVVRAAVGTGNLDFIDQVTERYLFTDFSATIDIAARLGHSHVVESFLQRGASTSYRTGDRTTITVAIANQNFSTVRLLLEWGASPDCLTDAVRAGDESTVLLLLDHGADPADEKAISTAVADCKMDIFSILIGAFSSRYPNGKKGFGQNILRQAISSRDLACLDALFKAKLGVKAHSGQGLCNQLLLFAIGEAGKGDAVIYDIICQLLEAGADPDAASSPKSRKRTADTALLRAIGKKDVRLVRMLLDRGADIQRPARNVLKRTPLQQSCEQGYFQMIKFLLDNGADLNAPAALNGGATALQLAAIQGNADIVLFLLSKGAKIHDPPAVINGRTALEGAAEHGRVSVLSILLAQGASGYRLEDIDQASRYAEEQGHEGCAHTLKLARFKLASLRVQ
ncbi:unnamed protein product [Clonostachys byssicola]|uniref:Clr5 domain-containing protein n=1 Tax=Clonostachys byssicola TaxID=160290 RepID=A0A9N9XWT6_9HYPO|nr:unnamed protein product [Clonostachys byssicola]